MKKLAFAFALALASMTSAHSQLDKIPLKPELATEEAAAEMRELFKHVKGVKHLPGAGFSLIETTTGRSFAISSNGRFVIQNPVFIDMWNGTQIASVNDFGNINRVDFDQMRINLDELSSFSFGNTADDAPEVVIFVDPYCPYCKGILDQAVALGKDYRFRAIVIPLLGEKSQATARDLVCATNRRAALEAVQKSEFASLSAVGENCNDEPIQRALVVSTVLGITGVPYTVMPSGTIHRGFTKDLGEKIEQDLAMYPSLSE